MNTTNTNSLAQNNKQENCSQLPLWGFDPVELLAIARRESYRYEEPLTAFCIDREDAAGEAVLSCVKRSEGKKAPEGFALGAIFTMMVRGSIGNQLGTARAKARQRTVSIEAVNKENEDYNLLDTIAEVEPAQFDENTPAGRLASLADALADAAKTQSGNHDVKSNFSHLKNKQLGKFEKNDMHSYKPRKESRLPKNQAVSAREYLRKIAPADFAVVFARA